MDIVIRYHQSAQQRGTESRTLTATVAAAVVGVVLLLITMVSIYVVGTGLKSMTIQEVVQDVSGTRAQCSSRMCVSNTLLRRYNIVRYFLELLLLLLIEELHP